MAASAGTQSKDARVVTHCVLENRELCEYKISTERWQDFVFTLNFKGVSQFSSVLDEAIRQAIELAPKTVRKASELEPKTEKVRKAIDRSPGGGG